MSEIRDVSLRLSSALPDGAATVTSSGLDLGPVTPLGSRGKIEVLLTVPALTAVEIPNGKTITCAVKWSDAEDLSNPTTFLPKAVVQTGAGGIGAAAASARFGLPSNAGRYLFLVITGSAPGDAAGHSALLEVVF